MSSPSWHGVGFIVFYRTSLWKEGSSCHIGWGLVLCELLDSISVGYWVTRRLGFWGADKSRQNVLSHFKSSSDFIFPDGYQMDSFTFTFCKMTSGTSASTYPYCLRKTRREEFLSIVVCCSGNCICRSAVWFQISWKLTGTAVLEIAMSVTQTATGWGIWTHRY